MRLDAICELTHPAFDIVIINIEVERRGGMNRADLADDQPDATACPLLMISDQRIVHHAPANAGTMRRSERPVLYFDVTKPDRLVDMGIGHALLSAICSRAIYGVHDCPDHSPAQY